MKANAIHSDAPHLGFQIAPMIDVVFVIMLFFMVMAGAIKAERYLSTSLPTNAVIDEPADALVLTVTEDGYVLMNDEEIGQPGDSRLQVLTVRLDQIRHEFDLRRSRMPVMLQTEEGARYQRIVDVMNSLAKAGVTDVTFTVGTE